MSEHHVVIADIIRLARKRDYFIKSANRAGNNAGAYVRTYLDWRADLSEAARAQIAKRAASIMKAHATGKPQAPENAAIAAEIADVIEAASDIVAAMDTPRNTAELAMKKLARKLPAYAFAKSVTGFGDLGFAVVVGAAGDIGNYATPDRLRRRLGLAPMAANGETRAMSNWKKGGLTAADWTEAGYNPRRRAAVFSCVEDSLFRAQWTGAAKSEDGQGKPKGRYGEVYARRRARTAETHPDWSKGHAHMDARRVMVQKLIDDLWAAWHAEIKGRSVTATQPPDVDAPSLGMAA